VFFVGLVAVLGACSGVKPGNARAHVPLTEAVVQQLASIGSSPGEGMVIRIFKESSELEVWKRTASGDYKFFKTYEICAWSGDLGPKFQEGDRQAPEGFYAITPGLLNPNSNFYLAFNTGFPNKYDQAHGRTGSHLMVHGDCSSRGCYSMTDESIAEIYALVRESFAGGNPSVQLQLFPFRMSPQNLARHASSPHLAFWKDIKEGYDRFELTKRPPNWDVCNGEYVFDVPRSAGVTVLDAAAACPAGVGEVTATAALQQKQAADEAAMQAEVAKLAEKEAKAVAEAERVAAEQAALKARGEAIGGFIGGIFGNKEAEVRKTMNPALLPPQPAPRIQRG
jgi:murein L,D-transpeptidase YafK